MATNSNKKNATAEHEGLDDIQTKPYEPILSPEQRRILGQVYQLILGWRRERMGRTMPAITSGETNVVPVVAMEVEA